MTEHKWSRDGETCLRCGDKDWRASEECEPKESYVAELEAERDRLREALEQIVNCTPANQPDKWPHHHHYLFVARAALEDK